MGVLSALASVFFTIMTVLKKNKKSNYTVVDNGIFQNKDLSLKAKGLLCLMLSLPDNWDYTLAGLAQLSSDGVDATRNALNELEQHGYFKRVTKRDNGKFDDVEYIISETPMFDESTLEKPMLENPILDNPPQLNTDIIKTKKNKRNIYKALMDDYNSICTRLDRCISMTDNRKRHIRARLAEHDYDQIVLAFHKCNESDFFCGINDRGWKGDFNWIIESEEHLAKILEGKYDNRIKFSKAESELLKAYEAIGGDYDNRPFGSG